MDLIYKFLIRYFICTIKSTISLKIKILMYKIIITPYSAALKFGVILNRQTLTSIPVYVS